MATLGGHTQHLDFSPNKDSFCFTKFKYRISLPKMNCKMLTTKMQLYAQFMYFSFLKSSRSINRGRNKSKGLWKRKISFLLYQIY